MKLVPTIWMVPFEFSRSLEFTFDTNLSLLKLWELWIKSHKLSIDIDLKMRLRKYRDEYHKLESQTELIC